MKTNYIGIGMNTKNRIRFTILGSSILYYSTSRFIMPLLFLIMAVSLAGAELDVDKEYQEIKGAVDIYANTSGGAEYDKAARLVLSRGTDAVPYLNRLFHESEDDYYRVAIISTLGAIPGASESLITLIENELKKPPEEWRGEAWVFRALNAVREIDSNRARKVASLALGGEGKRIYISTALVILRNHGTIDDILILRDFIHDRDTYGSNESDQLYARFAEKAIAVIEERSSNIGLSVTEKSSQTSVAGDVGRADSNDAIDDSRPHQDSSRTVESRLLLWIVPAVVVIFLALMAVRRRQ